MALLVSFLISFLTHSSLHGSPRLLPHQLPPRVSVAHPPDGGVVHVLDLIDGPLLHSLATGIWLQILLEIFDHVHHILQMIFLLRQVSGGYDMTQSEYSVRQHSQQL